MLNRDFRKYRTQRNKNIILSALNFSFASYDALCHKGLLTLFMGSATLMALKATEICINKMLEIKPQYEQIAARAKNINKLKHLDKQA